MSKYLTKLNNFGAFDNIFNGSFLDIFNKGISDIFDTSLISSQDKFSNMEVVEDGSSINVSLELPGVEIKDIDISIDSNNNLTIKGEKKSENTDEKDGKIVKTERIYGSFSRTIQLGKGVDIDNINAVYKDGVLKITVPKTEDEKESVKIEIKQ